MSRLWWLLRARWRRNPAPAPAVPRERASVASPCPGVLIWHDVPPVDGLWTRGSILHCSLCGAVFTSGHPLDIPHQLSDILREGITS